jgi:methyltransferase (TIGR00027 family)
MAQADQPRASVTALATAMMRAAHTRLDRPALIDDPWGDRLVLDAEREAIGMVTGDLRAHPTYATVILRTRFTEDALAAAVERGARQYVLVGAGMDSFALRRPAFAREVEVFEVDLPATQEFKLRRLEELGIEAPERFHAVAADLGEESLDEALERSAFRPGEAAFFSWLGVTAYLTREANMETLAAIARCGAEGSELAFTYIDAREISGEAERPELRTVLSNLAAAGEPWRSGFDPRELGDDLAAVGLELVEDLNGFGLVERYRTQGAGALHPVEAAHVALARVR